MTRQAMDTVLQYVRRLAGSPVGEAATDRALLGRFAQNHDEAAFAELVQRHAGLVWGVCRRTLAHAEDAEDAFQATFFLLARKAGHLRWEADVAPWLHAVALRTALKARTAGARRRARERHRCAMAPTEVNVTPERLEIGPVLDEEVQRLPTKYRVPVVLHFFEGKTYAEAAAVLGWPAGTVAARLARARAMLKKRLERRGVALSATLATAALASEAPAALVLATVRSAVLFAVGGAAANSILPPSVLILTKGVLRAMLITRLKIAGIIILTLGTLAAGAGMAGLRALPTARPAPKAEAQDKQDARPPAADAKQQVERLQQENERLNREVRELRDRAATLERKAGSGKEHRAAVVYEGKPAAYWLRQLQDRSPKYRQNAVEALGAIAPVDKSMIPVLVKALSDRAGNVSYTAALALGNLGKEGQRLLLTALHSGDDATRLHVAQALVSAPVPAETAVPALVAALQDKDAAVRAAASFSLSRVGTNMPTVELPALTKALQDSSGSVRLLAVQALRNLGSAGTPGLLEALHNGDVHVRRAAVRALDNVTNSNGQPIPESVFIALLLKTQDQDPDVSKEARQLLFARAVRTAGPNGKSLTSGLMLLELLQHGKEPAIRIAAARVMGQFRFTNEDAMALHDAARDDPDAKVRQAAEHAYRQLTTPAKGDDWSDQSPRPGGSRRGGVGGRGGFGGRHRPGGPG